MIILARNALLNKKVTSGFFVTGVFSIHKILLSV